MCRCYSLSRNVKSITRSWTSIEPRWPYMANDRAVVNVWRQHQRARCGFSFSPTAIHPSIHAHNSKQSISSQVQHPPHDRNTHGECVSPPMNSSSSSSSSSPFSESICMASSMKLTAFPSLGAEFWSLPNEASLVSFSLSWVKYCSANSSKSLGWFLNTSTVKLCNSSVSPSGISILIPVISLWMWTKPVCCEFQWFKSTQIRFSSRRVFWLAFFF